LEEDYSLIRRHIEHVIPGFDSYEARTDHPGGFVLPHPPRDSRSFKTASGKAVFTANELEYPTVPAGRLLLQTIRTYPTPVGCAAAYYPETNVLVPLDSVADESGTPTSKSVVVRLEAVL
jgi:hypothetical protein